MVIGRHTLPVLILVAAIQSKSIRAELPVIALPEYLIEGVERAIRIPAERITGEVDAVLILPDESYAERPGLVVESPWEPPGRPPLIWERSGRRAWITARGGSFGNFSGEGGIGRAASEIEWGAGASFNNPPQRQVVGWRFGWEAKGEASRAIGNAGVVGPQLQFKSHSFRRHRTVSTTELLTWEGLGFDVAVSPLPVGGGSIGGLLAVDRWATDATKSELILHREDAFKEGRIEVDLALAGEVVRNEESPLQLTKLDLRYRKPLSRSLVGSVGVLIYGGGTSSGGELIPLTPGEAAALQNDQKRSGYKPRLEIQWREPWDGVVSFSLAPDAELESLGGWTLRFPMMAQASRGTIREEALALRLEYRRQLTRSLEAALTGRISDSRHSLFPYHPGGDYWILMPRQLQESGGGIDITLDLGPNAGISVWGEGVQARTTGNLPGNRAPLKAPFTAGVQVIVSHFGITASSDLLWRDAAPVDFEGVNLYASYLRWDMSLHRGFGRSFDLTIGVENLVNKEYYNLLRYPAEPLMLYLKAGFR
ncbi:MAG: hypothetical protein FJY67_07050 [Calditrichaeota bacterium]|nr:hypothetical protein [Calditrichota bacterium]